MKTGQISDIVSLELSTFVKTRKKEGIAVGKQILIVEDNELNRAMLCEILSEEYQVLEAENGQEALEILRIHGDTVALILLDVMMPVMDGYAFLDLVRQDPQLSLIPVIVTTQSGSEEDEVAALSHGATDFVPKPYRPQVILHRVASLIKLRETAAMVNQFQFDRLTGLYSKEFFFRKVRERLQEDPEGDYSIVCSNIENFKLVNDVFGTQAGDHLLREVADITRSMVGQEGFCGRFSADRFLCLQRREQERLDRKNFGSHPEMELSPLMKSIVMRWGIYEITDPSIPVEQMCDRAMLAANSIRGQYNQFFAVYDDSLRGKLLREKAITDAMQKALDQGQFAVFYQPKYSLTEECLAGAEALVRWIHPEWGMISPGEFIPLFEKNGFIPKLDQYVWEQVCTQLQRWRETGRPVLPVSVNISRADMYQADVAQILSGLTARYGIEPGLLHLEITESAYAENTRTITTTVGKLRAMGFVVEMDDFGSGYSSLNMLSQMKLDVLKLDRSFIVSETSKSTELSILNDVISMAHRMRLRVVAEGVESRNQLERLRAVGCDYVQGFYFAKPMPAGEFEKLLNSSRLLEPRPAPAAGRREEPRCTLLIVDENQGYREKVRQAFLSQYQVLEAADADQALASIHTCSGTMAVILSMTLPEGGAEAVMKFLRHNPQYWNVPVLAALPDGSCVEKIPLTQEADDFLCKCHPVFDLSKRVQRLVELSSSGKRESALQDEANRDFLSGLLNRRGLQMAMSGIRKEELPLALYLFDLDNLKAVNDGCGHRGGDEMICAFAELLRRSTRDGDILCRYGGDEFLVVLKRLREGDTAIKKGEDICRDFQNAYAGEPFHASCSAGVVLCDAGEVPSMELIERADQAMYRAKREGKGHCYLWQKEQEK